MALLDSPVMYAAGRGIATISVRHDAILDVWYRDLTLGDLPAGPLAMSAEEDDERQVRFGVTETRIDLDAPPDGAADAYLRLHLLSARLVRPRELNMDGIFGQLSLVAWTELGAVHPADLDELRARRRMAGKPLTVHGLDKFPRMTDFVSPSGVRIADAGRVPAWCPPRRGHRGHARGLRQLQRGHARPRDGGGPHHPRQHRGRRL
jgi:2,3,4,5-tetrahydropyridine-2-carboxylate N-succinyltransferase